jgi:nitrilase
MEKVTVAAVQATPEFLDRDATVQKVVRLTKEAAVMGARLIVFPETFIPTYPDWVWRAAAWDGPFEALTARLREQSVEVPSAATDQLGKAAKRAKAYLSVGVNELDGSTIYNAQLLFGPDGEIVGKHRKLMPTGGERLVWGVGDGSDLDPVETPFGRVGGLICWENMMPLARTAIYAKGVDIWTAPTWDNDENWIANLRHIAREGRVYVIGACMLLRGSDIPDDIPGRELWGVRTIGRTPAGRRSSIPTGNSSPGRWSRRRGSSPPRLTRRWREPSGTASIPSATTAGPTCSR